MRAFLLGLALLAALIVLGSRFAIDEGEVVTLISVDDHGAHYETTLWILDLEDGLYLRAGRPEARWLARLRAHPEVEIERDGTKHAFLAHPDDRPDVRARVNAATDRKYGTANRLLGRFLDLERAVPVRLEPRAEPAPAP